jgi:hypothetical protein
MTPPAKKVIKLLTVCDPGLCPHSDPRLNGTEYARCSTHAHCCRGKTYNFIQKDEGD